MAPAAYPIKAKNDIFFRYQIKSIFRIPITATPAADPIINTEPPVPAQYAKNSQNIPSAAYIPASAIGYIPIAPATNGTLSTIEDRRPIITLDYIYSLCSLSIKSCI